MAAEASSTTTITTTATLNATGRDIVNALRAGKSIMVHTEINGYEEYNQPGAINFSEIDDKFLMTLGINGNWYTFDSTLDSPLTTSSSFFEESGGEDVK